MRAQLLFAITCLTVALSRGGLQDGFVNPPQDARPHVWWHWMNGNVTKEGITADLEAMAQVGIGGAQIFDADCGIPKGPVAFNSPEFYECFRWAAQEAKRLGLELAMHNCSGWSSSGGPWNTPEESMKELCVEEISVTGNQHWKVSIPSPENKHGFLRDIAVLAFPTPVSEEQDLSVAGGRVECKRLNTGVSENNISFPAPYCASELTIVTQNRVGRDRTIAMTIAVSDDGNAFRELRRFNVRNLPGIAQSIHFPKTTAKFWRLSVKPSSARTCELKSIKLDCRAVVEGLPGKMFVERERTSEDTIVEAPQSIVSAASIVDLTGKSEWDVPEGKWTVIRVCYRANGRGNHPATEKGRGLECDKLRKESVRKHFDAYVGKVLKELGPELSGNVKYGLNNVLIDSYEVGMQNWTQGFEDEFLKRNGYTITKWLPVFSGRVVESKKATEKFLSDFRRTIADLFAENYSGEFARLCHEHGLKFSLEPYGNMPGEDMQYGDYADIPMSEFWPTEAGSVDPGNAKLAASLGHVWGRRYVGAESFTAAPEHARWLHTPWTLKAQGDRVFSGGVNRIIFHRYAHQPWLNYLPGMTMGQWGTHFERTLTWWQEGAAWLRYLARCQWMLQEGTFRGDILFYRGNDPIASSSVSLPQGYDGDTCSLAGLKQTIVRDGSVVVPGGTHYRALVVSANENNAEVERLRSSGAKIYTNVSDALKGTGPDFFCEDKSLNLSFIHRGNAEAEWYFVASPSPTVVNAKCKFRVSGKQPEFWNPETGEIAMAPAWQESDGGTTLDIQFAPAGSVFIVFRKPSDGKHYVALDFKATNQCSAPVRNLKITKAEYGYFGDENKTWLDAKPFIERLLRAGHNDILVSNNTFGRDPADGIVKQLKVVWKDAQGEHVSLESEWKKLQLKPGIEIISATYGDVRAAESAQLIQSVDVTEKLNAAIKDGALSVKISNKLVDKDPAFLKVKKCIVNYTLDGIQETATVGENGTLILPPQNPFASPVGAEFFCNADGKRVVRAWNSLNCITRDTQENVANYSIDVPQTLQSLDGEWQVKFPKKEVSMELHSWTASEDAYIKYFSGTAIYSKECKLAWQLSNDERLFLELGRVENFAEVEVNGKKYPVLWKPPFRVDVTEQAKSSATLSIRVKVTNLWPNRLIGDDLLFADDCEWNGFALREIPQWVREGKPSPTGRSTFTTWKHWTKEDKPLPSGILGPAALRTCVEKVLP